jgi:hypothetical protein
MPNTQFRWDVAIAKLQAETGMVNGEVAVVHGYLAAGDGGGGTFFYDNAAVPDSSKVSTATNASPIEITTSAVHGLTTGQVVVIGGMVGNADANRRWSITVTSPTKFTLDASTGNSAYTSGGTIGDGGTTIPSTTAVALWRRIGWS